jgi:hypothetical protein
VALSVAQEWQSANHTAKYGHEFMNIKYFGWLPSSAFLKRANQLALPDLDIYQFGVYTGGSMKQIHKHIKTYRHMWGFDSFEGLPSETKGIHIEGKHWLSGAFSSKGALKVKSPEQAMRLVTAKLNNPKATLIKGFFNDSLPRMDLSSCRPALLIDIDSDLYVSAKQALTWLFEHQIARVGTLIRYDDWNVGDPSWGEPKAHKEISDEFGVTFRSFNGNEFEVIAVTYPFRPSR